MQSRWCYRPYMTAMLSAIALLLVIMLHTPTVIAQTAVDDYPLEQKLTASISGDLQDFARFGDSVSLYEETLVVGAPYEKVGNSNSAGSVYVYVRNDSSWSLQQKLTAESAPGVPDLEEGILFGWSVSIDAETIVVGTIGKTEGDNNNAGAVYVYVRSGSSWSLQQKLTAESAPGVPDLEENARFGDSVSIDNETLTVGVELKDEDVYMDAGAVYLYKRSDNIWSLEQKITAESAPGTLDLQFDARFGKSVSLSGETLVVGEPGKDLSSTTNAGAAYVYKRSGNTWSLEQKITAESTPGTPDQELFAGFGGSVSIDNETLIVGAGGKDENTNNNAGAVYVYTLSDDIWLLQQKLTAETAPTVPDLEASANFGDTVSLAGETLIVGADRKDENMNNDTGAIYVYKRNGNLWTVVSKVTAESALDTSDLEAGVRFGSSVDLDGETLIVGTPLKNEGGNTGAGAAYVYRANTFPNSMNDSTITSPNTAVTINVLANDTDINNDPLSITTVSNPDNGTTINNGNGTISYTPNGGFIGTDGFAYTISDGRGGTDTSTVTVTVSNTPPIPEDVTRDGVVSPEDAIFVINRVGDTKDETNAAADVNDDGSITEGDVNTVIAALGQSITE